MCLLFTGVGNFEIIIYWELEFCHYCLLGLGILWLLFTGGYNFVFIRFPRTLSARAWHLCVSVTSRLVPELTEHIFTQWIKGQSLGPSVPHTGVITPGLWHNQVTDLCYDFKIFEFKSRHLKYLSLKCAKLSLFPWFFLNISCCNAECHWPLCVLLSRWIHFLPVKSRRKWKGEKLIKLIKWMLNLLHESSRVPLFKPQNECDDKPGRIVWHGAVSDYSKHLKLYNVQCVHPLCSVTSDWLWFGLYYNY